MPRPKTAEIERTDAVTLESAVAKKLREYGDLIAGRQEDEKSAKSDIEKYKAELGELLINEGVDAVFDDRYNYTYTVGKSTSTNIKGIVDRMIEEGIDPVTAKAIIDENTVTKSHEKATIKVELRKTK